MERHDLGAGAYVDFEPAWVSSAEADRFLAELLRAVEWQRGKIMLFGRELSEPRLTAWIGDCDYTYSGRTVRARPWPKILTALRDRVEVHVGHKFNSVLLNRYRTGLDSMGFHSDDEPELGKNPIIASVTFGVARRFVLKPKRKTESGKDFDAWLGHGSLLVMGGTCQHTFRHAVPKQRTVTGERLNLTFRNLLRWSSPASAPRSAR